MAIKNKNLMMSLTESLNENKKQEIANFKKLKEATEDNVSYVRYLLDTAEDMDDVQQAIYQIDDSDLENEVQLMFDSCSEDDSLEEVISLVVSTMEDNAEYDEEMNESEIDDARKDSIEKGLISEDEISDESNEDDRKNTLIAKKDELESRLGDILQSIKDKQMDTEEFRKLSREAADLDSQIMDLDNQIHGVYESVNEAELFNMDEYKDLADEDDSVNIKELKMIQDYAVRKTKEIINYVYYNAPYSGIGDNILNDMLNVIKESLPNMNESINESDEDVKKGITDQLVSAGMTKEQAEQTAKGICNIFKNKVGSNQVVNEDVFVNGDEVVTEQITDIIPLLNAVEDELNEEKYRIDIDEDIKDKNYYYNYLDKILSNISSARNTLNKYLETDNSVKENVNEDVSVNEDDNSLNNIVWDNIEDYDDSEKEEIRNILQNLDFEVAGVDGHSVSIKLKQNGMVFWIDYSSEGSDIVGDWNQYIFDTTNSEDRIRKAIQTSYYEDTGDTIALEPMESAGFEYLENKGIIKDTGKGYSFTDINESVNQDGFPNSDELQKYFIGLSELPDEVEIDNVKYKMEQYGGSGDNCYAIYTDINNNDSYIKVFYSLNKTENGSYKGISKINGVSDLRESAKPIKEAAITEKNLLKSQGNVYMFECKGNSDFSHIVGENYNEEENTLENVETYNNKEDADKDYLGRCEITTESQKSRNIEDGLDESINNSEKVVNKFIDTLKKELPEYDWDYRFEGEQIVFYDKNEDFDFSNIDINYEKVDDIIKSIFGKDAYLDAQNSVIGVVSESVHNQVRNSLSESDDSYNYEELWVQLPETFTAFVRNEIEDVVDGDLSEFMSLTAQDILDSYNENYGEEIYDSEEELEDEEDSYNYLGYIESRLNDAKQKAGVDKLDSDSYKVKSYHVENMGGGTMAIFGQLEDGRYFAGNEDGLNLYDIDVWPYHEKDTSEEEFQQLEKDHNIGSIDSIGNKFEYEKIISQTNF